MIDHSINCREGPIPPIKFRTRDLLLTFISLKLTRGGTYVSSLLKLYVSLRDRLSGREIDYKQISTLTLFIYSVFESFEDNAA